MPSGRTHDAITFLLAIPATVAAYTVTRDIWSAATLGVAFLFGGLMFGPDLDTVSRQYSRWHFFRFLWFPYRSFFDHRSRFSHGLIFGSLIRVVYFMGVLTLATYVLALAWTGMSDDSVPDIRDFAIAWRLVGEFVRTNLGDGFFPLSFVGLWLGAASHTFTDMAGSFVKTGRVAKFL
ncbi:MAG: metal-binding protein [Pyrinomonadaceae bacterium]|nr:metal-binding protein [Acidobacteriota bacterium]MBK7933484.1 metal-binding protein [Acidobacteriota bacterium]MBP7377664.1 metal-binding protein [Pyrinomonadaceae bacterium]